MKASDHLGRLLLWGTGAGTGPISHEINYYEYSGVWRVCRLNEIPIPPGGTLQFYVTVMYSCYNTDVTTGFGLYTRAPY